MLLILNFPEAVRIHPSSPGGFLFPWATTPLTVQFWGRWEDSTSKTSESKQRWEAGLQMCNRLGFLPYVGWETATLIFSREDSGMQSCSLEALVFNHKTRQSSAPKPMWNQVICRASLPFHLPHASIYLFHLVAHHLACSKNWTQSAFLEETLVKFCSFS